MCSLVSPKVANLYMEHFERKPLSTWAIPFLDTLVKPEADNTLILTVYRKPSLTDQYLQWDSHHNLAAKYSVINTIAHRAWMVCIKPEILSIELKQVGKALTKCKYPTWALDKAKRKYHSY